MYEIFETDCWAVTHRRDARYPGYLIVSSKHEGRDLGDLPGETLIELGAVLARTECLLKSYFKPFRVISTKLGFSNGFSCHFHMLPVSHELLEEIRSHPSYTNEPDGNDVLLFTSREYCERSLDKKETKRQYETVCELKKYCAQKNKKKIKGTPIQIIGVFGCPLFFSTVFLCDSRSKI
ncbi:MAG: hypothetical protein ACR2PX_13120 [Endozoicomonas sp.]|uniref:hypothetical protein n=1 Tax=Endozoicomonas sp. TaxID=1892382 RepID=UPI003D9B5736